MDLPSELLLIHQPVRLKIMGLLYKHRDVGFTQARDHLGLTDGNLASHVKKLDEAGFMTARNVLLRSGFELRYTITPKGAQAFRHYLHELRAFLAATDVPIAAADDGAATKEVDDPQAPTAATDRAN